MMTTTVLVPIVFLVVLLRLLLWLLLDLAVTAPRARAQGLDLLVDLLRLV